MTEGAEQELDISDVDYPSDSEKLDELQEEADDLFSDMERIVEEMRETQKQVVEARKAMNSLYTDFTDCASAFAEVIDDIRNVACQPDFSSNKKSQKNESN